MSSFLQTQIDQCFQQGSVTPKNPVLVGSRYRYENNVFLVKSNIHVRM